MQMLKEAKRNFRAKLIAGIRYGSLAIAITFVAAVCSFFFSDQVNGQAISVNGGSIQGTIADSSGAVIPDASVTISSKATGFSRILKTDASGFYSIGPLNPGSYQITVEAPGYSRLVVDTVVRTGTATTGSYKLSVGQATTEITVNAGAVQVNTEQPGVSGVINAQQIDSLPINGRNFLDVAQLEPGVVLQSGESFDPTKAGFSAISVNGVSGRTTRILLDGQDITDENVGTTLMNVSTGSIDEFQINRSTQDVSGELTSSGQVLVATRSGTNNIHGQLFYNFQDQDAGFAEYQGTLDPFQRNNFGGRVGGPILKDKLFYFASVERIKQDAATNASLGPRFRGTSFAQQFPNIPSPYRLTYSAGRLDWNGPWGGHYFARINYDVDATVANNYGYGYWIYANRDNTPGIAGGADFVTGAFTHSFRISYEKFHNLISDRHQSAYVAYPGLAISFTAQNFASGANPLAPQETYQSDKQFRYDGGWTHGNHNVRFGASLNRLLGGGYASFYGIDPRALLSSSGNTNSATWGDPLSYVPHEIRLGNGQGFFSEVPGFGLPAGGQEDWRMGAYLADAWKARPDLTLTFGLRYNRDTGRANQDLGVIPCSDIDTTVFPNPPCTGSTPLLDQWGAGLGKRVNQPNVNFGPQIGLAYQIAGSSKTVFRAGFGIYYDSNVWNNILFDRENRLRSGLFNQVYSGVCLNTDQVPFPDGAHDSVDGVAIADICNMPLSQGAKYWVDLENQLKAATAAAGANGNINPSYVGEILAIQSAFYAPHYVSPYSEQFNFGLQRELWKGSVLTVDYIHNSTLKIQQTIDMNHDGAARFLNQTAAKNAIAATLQQCGVSSIDAAIAACPGLHKNSNGSVGGATIYDFAGNGLDSGANYSGGLPGAYVHGSTDQGAAFAGQNLNVGQGLFNFPSGRSGYDALQFNFRQQARHPLPGILDSNFEVSYNLSRMVTTSKGGGDQFFTNVPYDYDNQTRYIGYGSLDQLHNLSFGGSFTIKYGPQIGLIGHFRSATPTDLLLDNLNGTADIFKDDITGDGTTGDPVPGTNPGAYMRQYSGGNLNKLISNYNTKYAGQLTPAGKALVNAGLFRSDQLVNLGGAQQKIQPLDGKAWSNSMFKGLDASFAYPIRLKFISESASLEPEIAIYNVANFTNYSAGPTGTLLTIPDYDTYSGGGYVNEPLDPTLKDSDRTKRGSGTYSQGAPRSMEFQVRFNF
jgi:hypothetical protein